MTATTTITRTLTLKQQTLAEGLAHRFGIDAERIYFLNPEKPEEPWLPAESLITVARQSGDFQTVDESFDQYIAPLQQVVHRATVITSNGRSFTRSGVATINERADMDAHALAAGRAVGAALTAAGFNPLRPGAVPDLELRLGTDPRELAAAGAAAAALPSDEAQSRNSDLKRIHALAVEKGLIHLLPGGGRDMAEYRRQLSEHYGQTSAAGFDALQRASLINFLERLPEADEFADVA